MRLEAIRAGNHPPDDINVIVEVPVGGEPTKYEIDKASGALVVDRFLYTPMRYPGNHGFMPHTRCGDGDPLEVLVASEPGKWVKIARWGDVAAAREFIVEAIGRAGP